MSLCMLREGRAGVFRVEVEKAVGHFNGVGRLDLKHATRVVMHFDTSCDTDDLYFTQWCVAAGAGPQTHIFQSPSRMTHTLNPKP